MKNESTDERIEQLQKMLQLAPNEVFVLYALGLEYQKISEFEKAIAYFDRVLANDKNYLAAYYQKSIALAEINQITAAINTLESGLAMAKAQGNFKTVAEMNNLKMNLKLELD